MRKILTAKRGILSGLLTAVFLLCGAVFAADGAIVPDSLTCERLASAVGIDAAVPRLGWVNRAVDASATGLNQTAYRIMAATCPLKLASDEANLWDSGWVESSENLDIPYAGKPLSSAQKVFWKVAVKDQNGVVSEWKNSSFVTGILLPEDWSAKWIAQTNEQKGTVDVDGFSWIGNTKAGNEMFVKKEFDLSAEMLDKPFVALFRYAANYKFDLFVNDQKAGYSIGMVFNPDLLRTLDVTKLLVPGKNTISARVYVDNESQGIPAFFAKFELLLLIPDPWTPGRGTPDQMLMSFGTGDSWQVSDKADGEFAAAKVLYAVDEGPWGKLRRFSEKTSPAFAKEFSLAEGKKVVSAVLNITGAGFYEASLDGEKIGNKLLDPAPTRFEKRILYSTYDLTEKLADGGKHRFDVLVGHGWHDVRSVVTWNFDAAPWRDNPSMIAQLDVTYADGTKEQIISDDSWDSVTSPVLFDCIRQGEIVDGAFERKTLGKAACVEAPTEQLTAEAIPAAVILKEFPARSAYQIGDKTWIVDLGADIAGWCRITFRNLKKGTSVRLRYAERLYEDGTIDRSTIALHFMEGSPAYYAGGKGEFQTDYYIAAGKEAEVFEPRFTYNGFQYIEVTGLDEAPNPADFTACVVGNQFPTAGSFLCSNSLFNAIQSAADSSYRANFVDGYPTDCPHREKNGWTGDAQLACELAMYNYENTAGYEKWIQDLRDEQRENGNFAAIVPSGGWGYAWGNGPAWDASLVLIPWFNYIYKGDRLILEENYEAMKKYVDYTTTRADDRFIVTHGLGDWVPCHTVTPVEVTSTGYWYADAKIVARTAELLGKADDAAKYNALAEKIKAAFIKAEKKENGVYSIGSQTSQSCAVYQGFADEADIPEAVNRLVEQVDAADGHLDVGILGAKYLLRTLGEQGQNSRAIQMMLQETKPCYADWIKRGGGTLWEDWKEGDSRNHIMFGDVSAWFYQYLCGIRLDGEKRLETAEFLPADGTIAFKKFVFDLRCLNKDQLCAPGIDPIYWASASVETVRGQIRSSWRWNDDFSQLTVSVEIPVGSTADVVTPNPNTVIAGLESGCYTFIFDGEFNLKEKKTGEFMDSTGVLHESLVTVNVNGDSLASYPETVRKGIAWLKSTDLSALPLGKTEIDGDAVYVNVQEYETKPADDFSAEGHKKYIDIQVLTSGKELIGVTSPSPDMPITEPYSDADDYYLIDKSIMPFISDNTASSGRIILKAGEFVIFTPNDLHAPCLAADGPEKVRKIVVKCRL